MAGGGAFRGSSRLLFGERACRLRNDRGTTERWREKESESERNKEKREKKNDVRVRVYARVSLRVSLFVI